MPQGLPRKLRRVFALQALLAVVAVVACLYVSTVVGRGMLASQWVRAEADRYWVESARDPAFPAPWTSSVHGYFVPAGTDPADAGVPETYLDAGPGLHRMQVPGASQRLLVEDGPGGRLYMRIAFPLLDHAGLWSLLIASLLTGGAITMVSWLSYRIARRMVLPVTTLAAQVASWDPRQLDLDAIDPERLPGAVGREVHLLGGALRGLAERTQAFIRRERDFTREASHELRTPLTVVRVATDMLRRDPELPQRMQRSLDRLQVAARDMEAVVDALLILAREDEPGNGEEFDALDVATEAVNVGQVLLDELPDAAMVRLALVERGAPRLRGSRRALAVILEQLVRNACTFTVEGTVDVLVEDDRVEVRDTGVGMERDVIERAFEPFYRADQYVGGRGLGLAVVRRLAARFGWSVDIDSTPGKGTNAAVRFQPRRDP
ncbi:sensor histidine kinase [Luteimonas terricola]|uniref:histidine kinase n=1 Tax=Luteimonas terricola TaxID=645597 RepID=A0ABQ2E8H4_9GAMM|nr:HAMP domain-containing sensor histidine kinase [Luteimonas terricola]GGK00182.1 sensor histidine kinase [Luteimonas terricola]